MYFITGLNLHFRFRSCSKSAPLPASAAYPARAAPPCPSPRSPAATSTAAAVSIPRLEWAWASVAATSRSARHRRRAAATGAATTVPEEAPRVITATGAPTRWLPHFPAYRRWTSIRCPACSHSRPAALPTTLPPAIRTRPPHSPTQCIRTRCSFRRTPTIMARCTRSTSSTSTSNPRSRHRTLATRFSKVVVATISAVMVVPEEWPTLPVATMKPVLERPHHLLLRRQPCIPA